MFGIHDLTLFIISGLILNILPGPDSLLIITRSASQGWRAGSCAALGIGSGTMIHILVAALGLSALLATSATAFTVVKWIGALYIAYIGINLLRKKQESTAIPLLTTSQSYRKIYLQGILTNILNPKVALFFLAFVPQFIVADAPNKSLAFLILGCIFNLSGMLWCNALSIFTALASSRLKIKPLISLWLSRAAGGLFLALGLRLALSEQN